VRGTVNCEVEVGSDLPFHAEAELLVWPELRALWSKEPPMRYWRSRGQAADGDDSLVFLIRLDGTSSVSQRGRDVSLRKGDGVGFLGAEPASAAVSEVECLSLVTSRTALAPLIGNDVAGKAMRVIPSHCEAMRLLTNYAGILRQGAAPTTPELRHLVSMHIHDLIAMALGATRDGLAIAEGRGLRAARLRAIKADILANLGNSDLTVNAAALRQRVTPRYVQMLFQEEGTTFSEFVLGQRLTHVYHGLRDPRFRRMSISGIAFAAGFGELSYFNRTFRRRFGMSPSELRCADLALGP
jgi:AraC-like DNA-binding protein